MITEIHTMKPFRKTGMGVIRLDKLACRNNMCIKIGDKEICPIGYDTYGHPVISEQNFKYYRALKANHSRESKTFLLKVEYEEMYFCIRESFFDSKEAIAKAILDEEKSLSKLKQILIWRKQFYFSKKKDLNIFILFNKYVMANDGHVYYLDEPMCDNVEDVIQIDDSKRISFSREAHIPDATDVCSICGKKFTLQDVKDGIISEGNNAEKNHKECYASFFEEVELSIASQIIDAVYDDLPVNISKKDGIYAYDTEDGEIRIRFEKDIIVLDFSKSKIFDYAIIDEDEDKCIRVCSKAKAIQFLQVVNKAI